MTKVEYAEQTLYRELSDICPETFFVGVGKRISNEIVLIIYIDTGDTDVLSCLPDNWEGFRIIVKNLDSLISLIPD